ncbi:PEP-CTERM sorting domain-containing protein [Ideonella sp. BN130291]|uniref:PEP-CTERM sorting domain-containing protein n=1 Tax=Ideonella sp. BN130291 TaxID=3112940 RepID=UPI002E25ADA5|nr:PEP-CTERM sorting domain-containing protein [Ideonella sp. BN130291]
MTMRNKAAGVLASTLAMLAPQAWADTASVAVSNVKVQVMDTVPGDDIWPWAVFFTGDPSWLSYTTLAGAHVEAPVADQASQGWLGTVQSATASSGGSMAQAGTTAGDLYGSSGPGGWASVSAVDGQQGWAYATVFNGLFLAGAQTRFVVTASVDGLTAAGASAQANTSIEICDNDGSCSPLGYSEALTFGGFGFPVPTSLRAEWTNPTSDAAWGTLNVSMAAAAQSTLLPVPEPATGLLFLAGVAALCAAGTRRPQR